MDSLLSLGGEFYKCQLDGVAASVVGSSTSQRADFPDKDERSDREARVGAAG